MYSYRTYSRLQKARFWGWGMVMCQLLGFYCTVALKCFLYGYLKA